MTNILMDKTNTWLFNELRNADLKFEGIKFSTPFFEKTPSEYDKYLFKVICSKYDNFEVFELSNISKFKNRYEFNSYMDNETIILKTGEKK